MCIPLTAHVIGDVTGGFSGVQLVETWVVVCGAMMLMMWSEVLLSSEVIHAAKASGAGHFCRKE
ncbi:hypothetical protein E2C01_017420 [Portunus trituberculatus]|uniref:Uncharacterized protein n=1 Tax=Portunus trituberculatus TaxID=210409 RepID=A0A5B7DTE2_PORTR|nr:hypothetical protein [Portunus trituberculatus]